MTHEEIKILISAYKDNELPLAQKHMVQDHLNTCAECQKEYKLYQAISSSLKYWPEETLSPDEEIQMQKKFKRRASMFTLSSRNLMALGTTLALTVIIGSVVQTYLHPYRQMQGVMGGRLKSAADDIGDQYSAQGLVMASANLAALRDKAITMPMAAAPVPAALQMEMPVFHRAIYRSTMAYNNAPDHKIIKNADITLKVDNAAKTQDNLEALVAKYNGVISSENIEKTADGSRSGVMVISVPPKDLDKILPELRKLGEVQSESQSGSDVTGQYAMDQAQLDHYMQQRENLTKLLKKNTQDIENNTYIQNQMTNVEYNIDNLQSTLKNLDDQSFMATVTVNFYDTVDTTPKEPGLKDQMAQTFKDSVKSTLKTVYTIGLASFSGIFIVACFLLQLGLWALLFWGIYVIIRKFLIK